MILLNQLYQEKKLKVLACFAFIYIIGGVILMLSLVAAVKQVKYGALTVKSQAALKDFLLTWLKQPKSLSCWKHLWQYYVKSPYRVGLPLNYSDFTSVR